MHPRSATTLAAALLLTAAVRAQGAAEEPASAEVPPLGPEATATLIHAYETSPEWAMKALVLLSLGRDWHPDGAGMVVAALKDRDHRLLPYGIETVLRASDRVIGAIGTRELVETLVEELQKAKNELVQERLLAALRRFASGVEAEDRADWRRWWRDARDGWTPAPWTPAGTVPGEGTVSSKTVDRAFDLRDAGLEVAFVLDTTGSMQRAIDSARDAIDDVSAILAGITPSLRLGLVHYRDFGDMSDGAKLLVPLTRNHRQVKDKLAGLVASGGGDIPERVEKGVEAALGREMKWTRTANRMLLVIGDAPPHVEVERELLDMVRRAYEHPFVTGKQPVTGGPSDLRPFVTSAIATGKGAEGAFAEIARAGGGIFTVLGDVRKVDGRRIANADGTVARTAPERIAEHVLLLSFGAAHEAQLRAFVDVFFRYRAAGAM